jgi:hypothetical protein
MRWILAIVLTVACLGCAKSEVSSDDMAKVRDDFSQDKYEKAMIAAGKGAELEKEKAAAAARGESQ